MFRSTRNAPRPIRSIQNTLAALVRRAGLTRPGMSAHSLRHTVALAWLRQHPGKLVDLAPLRGHESLASTVLDTRASREDLAQGVDAQGVEQTPFHRDG